MGLPSTDNSPAFSSKDIIHEGRDGPKPSPGIPAGKTSEIGCESWMKRSLGAEPIESLCGKIIRQINKRPLIFGE